MKLSEFDIRYIKGVGPKKALLFYKLGIKNLYDLITYYPRDYFDRSNMVPLDFEEVNFGELLTVKGNVVKKNVRYLRRMKLFELYISDGSNTVTALFFNQPYLLNAFNLGDAVCVSGKLDYFNGRYQIIANYYEKIDADSQPDAILPIYSLTAGLNQKFFRRIMKQTLLAYLDDLSENIPENILKKYNFLGRKDAVKFIHFPNSRDDAQNAARRIAFEEFYLYELEVKRRIEKLKSEKNGFSFTEKSLDTKNYGNLFSFRLTGSQAEVVNEIKNDLISNRPMNRLLQGDVGSGKTAVAFYPLYAASLSGYVGVYLAPTEILALQTYKLFSEWSGMNGIEVELLTSSVTGKKRGELADKLRRGDPLILCGTHAVLQEKVDISNLAVIVIDEQHKFGVRHRAFLRKRFPRPHTLIMTATPIPRTLGLVLFADMDVSVLRDFPFGKKDIKTYVVGERDKAKMFTFVKNELRRGKQAYYIFPLIDESDKLELKSAVAEYEKLSETVFSEFGLGLIHGRMKMNEKESVMADFKAGKIDLVFATTVIEVGIDNKNANLIIIENADRFGLSQLHQIRGRIGRGGERGYCFLVAEPKNEIAKKRLDFMVKTNDGFEIAEADLFIRGPGDFLGARQSGLPKFKVADILRNSKLLELAKKEAGF